MSNVSSGSDTEASEVIFEDNGDYIETNLITEDDIKSYRLHVATEIGSTGAPLKEALPALDLAKMIYKRRLVKQTTNEADEREKSIEKLKDKIKKKKTKKKKRSSVSPESKSKRKSDSSKSRSRSPTKKSSRKRSRSKSRRSKSKSRSSRKRSRSRERRRKRRSRSRQRHRSRTRGSRRYRKKVWESKSRSRSRSNSKDREDYVTKCRTIQNGPELPVSRPIDRSRRRRRRSSSSSVERPSRGLPSSSSYLAIEGPEMSKALVTLYPSDTPGVAMPVLERVRLPAALAQQLFPVSCGSEHKDEESEKLLAIEAAKKDGQDGTKEEETKPPPTLSEIMQMRIEANKLILKNPHDSAAKKILHEAQILMNRWQAVSAKSTGGRFTGQVLATPLPKELLDSHHPLTWARKDMFLNLAPVTESPGKTLMMKMGWSSGQGLGKEGHGDVNPLTLCVKTDRKGLMTGTEVAKKVAGSDRAINLVGCNWVVKIVNGKHAVSGIGEIHQHIGRPCPEYLDNPAPGIHQITCKTAWGQFTPPSPAPNKKEAKGRAALFALTRIIAIEADKYNQACPDEAPASGVLCVEFKTAGSGGGAKYNANFSNPNKVYIDVKKLSQGSREGSPGIPHIPPPAQPTATPPHTTSKYGNQAIDDLISRHRNSAPPPRPARPLQPFRQPYPRGAPPPHGIRPPHPGPRHMVPPAHRPPSPLGHPPGAPRPPPRLSGPPGPYRPPGPARPQKPNNIQQMIAMATKLTGKKYGNPVPRTRPPGPHIPRPP